MLGRAHVSNNSSASCAIVAESLLKELRANERHGAAKVLAQTLLRVLDGYKFETLARTQTHHGVLRRTPHTPAFRIQTCDSQRVESALNRTRLAIFGERATDETVDLLANVIKSEFGLIPNSNTQHEDRVRLRAELDQFLTRLVSELEPAS